VRDLTIPDSLAARERFLASVWRELASSSDDWEGALARLARLAVPECADWCCGHIEEAATIARSVQIAYPYPESGTLAELLRRGQPTAATSAQPQRSKIILVPNVDQSRLAGIAGEHLDVLKAIGPQSFLVVPINAHGRPFAVITFAYTRRSGRRYGANDIAWAVNLAARARLAIERAALRHELETANLAKEQLLATLSHELRNPLNMIAGYVRLLQSDVLDREIRSRANGALEQNIALLGRLIDDLVEASRIASGHLKLQRTPLLVSSVVQDVVDAVQPTADAKSVAVQCVVQPSAGSVHADRDRLRQVLWNLVSNAVKFTPAGGRVDVGVDRTESHVEISVADSGVGIPSECLPQLFQPFWQEDARFSRIHGGLGLGLALVRRVVELHGGTVRAESAGPGGGATFTVVLPRWPYLQAERGSNGLIARLAGLRVLLIEDDEDWTELVVDLLTLAGARVMVERSAQAALAQLEAKHPHVLLVNIDLPQLEGWELISQIRKSGSKHSRSVGAAAVSGHAHAEDRERALVAGFQMFVPKSIVAEDLLDAVIRLATMGVDARPAS
jgi:signal transduction histidine kinase/CheY-like chemotaxis protein